MGAAIEEVPPLCAAEAARATGASLILGRASGGPVLAGMPYIVGEQRPELFVPRESGYILPSVPSMGPAHAGGGNAAPWPITVNVPVAGSVQT